MLFKEIIAVYSENHTKPINTNSVKTVKKTGKIIQRFVGKILYGDNPTGRKVKSIHGGGDTHICTHNKRKKNTAKNVWGIPKRGKKHGNIQAMCPRSL
jgi:hypothetical protein